MKTNNAFEQIFHPLLTEFCREIKPIQINDDFPAIFLPHTMNNYSNAERKIFYFGRDTNGWLETGELMRAYSKNDLSSFFENTKQWANDFCFFKYTKNQAYGFWTLVIRLHLRLKGFKENLKIGEDFPKNFYEYINDFGWGNTNAIETDQSQKNQSLWETLDKKKYRAIKKKSKKFDRLKCTIDAFKPDIVFVFNWNKQYCQPQNFLEGLVYQEQNIDIVNGKFTYYYLPESKTKLLWTIHPNFLRFVKNYNIDNLIDEIERYFRSIEN
ncbi:MAG: hypothetical protein WBM02_12435 [bacterium]